MRLVTGDDVAKVIRAPGIAAIFDYVVQAAGVQTGVLGQRFQDEWQVGISHWADVPHQEAASPPEQEHAPRCHGGR